MLSIFDGLRDITLASVAFRLILSTLCGGIVGMEREFKRRSAGFRTHILICLGAAMTTLTSEFWLVYMRYYLDAARLGAGVVAGMGFIGAGTIIVTRRPRVKGLTTDAGLWTVSRAEERGFYFFRAAPACRCDLADAFPVPVAADKENAVFPCLCAQKGLKPDAEF